MDTDSLRYVIAILETKVQMYEATAFYLKSLAFKIAGGGAGVTLASHLITYLIKKIKNK